MFKCQNCSQEFHFHIREKLNPYNFSANENELFFFSFVTILVDKIDFSDIEAKNDADIRLSGHVRFDL